MIRRLFIIALWSCLLLGGASQAQDPLRVRIQLTNSKEYLGAVSSRDSESVVFLPYGAEQPVRIPDRQIVYIKLMRPDSSDTKEIDRLFDVGEYRSVAEKLNMLLSPYSDYITLPSNLTHLFLKWLAASYWTGDFDRTLMLATALAGAVAQEDQQTLLFYGGLARFEKGDFQGMAAFLQSPDADTTYPPESAARLYIESRMLQHKENYIQAIRTAALLMVRHSRDADWMPKAELLCAEIYVQLGMPDSANAVLADIDALYSDPDIQKQAAVIAAKNNGDER